MQLYFWIRIQQLKLMRILENPDPKPWWEVLCRYLFYVTFVFIFLQIYIFSNLKWKIFLLVWLQILEPD